MAPRVVVITGCSSGIGLETAVLLANDKEKCFRVFATMRNLDKKDQLESAAGSTLDQTLFIHQLDVTKEDTIQKFMERINKEEEGVDILINNAGIGQGGALELVTMSQIRTVFETNVFGLIRMTQVILPGMKAKRSGRIINISSSLGLFAHPFTDIYSSSKFAVEGFSEAIAPVLKQFNISLSIIEPGPVMTPNMDNIIANNTGSLYHVPTDPAVDELTQKLIKTSFESNAKYFPKLIQTAAEIASVIQDAILSDKPHLRYITNEAYRKILTETKCVDLTGDLTVDKIREDAGWEK